MAGSYTEKDMWRDLHLGMRSVAAPDELEMDRHEDRLTPGIPDVSYTICVDRDLGAGLNGWVELKTFESHSVVHMADCMIRPRFEPQQIPWLARRAKLGGLVFVLVRINYVKHNQTAWLLMDAAQVMHLKLGQSLSFLVSQGARVLWADKSDRLSPLQWRHLLDCLSGAVLGV